MDLRAHYARTNHSSKGFRSLTAVLPHFEPGASPSRVAFRKVEAGRNRRISRLERGCKRAAESARRVTIAGYPVLSTGASGSVELTIDRTNTPTPTGSVSVLAGETWNFQAWYRDLHPGPTSNFTDALSVTFL